MTKISAKIVADSKNQFNNRLTTFVLTFPRYILAELNTHRMLSKNSASSRAIPFKKMVKSVYYNPFTPIAYMKDHSGMQGSEYFTGWKVSIIKFFWMLASKFAIISALILNKLGLTKQLVNRILEPFMWHTVILSGTEFENFFSLRCSEYADIHIQKLAYEMLEAYNASTPKQLKEGEWHIPFGDKFDKNLLYETLLKIENQKNKSSFTAIQFTEKQYLEAKIKIAIARCARVSYTVVGEEGKPDNYENDIKLFDRLATSGHYSPFEHVGRAMDDEEYAFKSSYNYDLDEPKNEVKFFVEQNEVPYKGTWGWSGNFRGFIQYRKTLANENRKDARVVQK
jgi:thymidylate synthase ThyX